MSLSERLDRFGRRHPRVTTLALLLLTACVTLVLLYRDQAPLVMYQGF
jgi:hypothetical protein